ncbi:hypothetical protein [Agreia sp. COWG]|uniref:hypothetical protein n=1 Tax=Agreia sp. COWG TaxID=2773266 RepID=UPI00192818E5|nr:hypothetical protein [Agreia sp. COWG]CAD5999157.1 conserved membrane protein of unknown function [Agreia sp. COWG]
MNIIFNLPPALIIGLLVSTVLPLLVGLVTSRVTKPGTKAILLAVLASVAGLLTELAASIAASTTYDLGSGLVLAVTSFLIATGLHFGIYKPTGASAALQRVGEPKHARDDGSYDATSA